MTLEVGCLLAAPLLNLEAIRFAFEKGGIDIPKKILIVDDDHEIRAFMTLGLESAGFEVLCAVDGDEGLFVAKRDKPDLIVLDLTMPRMHGYAVCEAVRADKELAKTKIVVTSGKNY